MAVEQREAAGRTPRPKTLTRTFWMPLASLLAVELYAGKFDGWGAWAAAPLFILPFVLGLVVTAAGCAQCEQERRAKSLRGSSIAFTLIAALPLLWIFVRRHVV
jgi:hypothetical protein